MEHELQLNAINELFGKTIELMTHNNRTKYTLIIDASGASMTFTDDTSGASMKFTDLIKQGIDAIKQWIGAPILLPFQNKDLLFDVGKQIRLFRSKAPTDTKWDEQLIVKPFSVPQRWKIWMCCVYENGYYIVLRIAPINSNRPAYFFRSDSSITRVRDNIRSNLGL